MRTCQGGTAVPPWQVHARNEVEFSYALRSGDYLESAESVVG